MYQVSLKRTGKTKLRLNLPSDASEMKLASKIDFECADMELTEWLSKNANNLAESKDQFILLLLKCISKFTGVSFAEFMDLDSSYLSRINNSDLYDHFERLTENKINPDFKLEELEHSLLQVYTLIYNTIHSAKPKLREYGAEKFQYTYKDPDTNETVTETLVISPIFRDKFLNQIRFKSINIKQLVEILETERNYMQMLQAADVEEEKAADSTKTKAERALELFIDLEAVKEKEEKKKKANPDPFGNFIYSKIISHIAMLCIREGDKAPLDKFEFINWFERRKRILKDIDYQTAIDVEYWVSSFWDNLKSNPKMWYFYNSREPIDEYEQKARIKMMKINEEIFNRIGYNSIISRLIDLDPWSQPGMSKIESVYNGSAEEGIELLSVANSNY